MTWFTGGEDGGASVTDAAFTIPLGSQSSEQQRLVQCGQMTPFGSAGQEVEGALREVVGAPLVGGGGVERTSEGRAQSDVVSSSSGGVADYPAVGERGGESLTNSESGAVEGSGVTAVSSGLRLCSEGFDGLFEDSAVPERPAGKKRAAGNGPGRKGKGKGRAKKVLTEENENESLDCSFERNGCVLLQEVGAMGEFSSGGVGREEEEVGSVGSDGWMPTREEVEAMEREMMEGEEEGEGEGESTEYSTDEELGPGMCYR